jgi:serine/threonine protein kinase
MVVLGPYCVKHPVCDDCALTLRECPVCGKTVRQNTAGANDSEADAGAASGLRSGNTPTPLPDTLPDKKRPRISPVQPVAQPRVSRNGGWRLGRHLGTGGWAEVFEAKDRGGRGCALKICLAPEEVEGNTDPATMLMREFETYRALSGLRGIVPIMPDTEHSRSTATRWDGYNFFMFAMKRVGPDLETWRRSFKGVISNGMVSTVALKMIDVLKGIHNRGYLHRDVTPNNVAFDFYGEGGGDNEIYLLDLGIATPIYARDGTRLFLRGGGTYAYNSISVNRGKPRTKADDLESLGYTLLFLVLGELPWIFNGASISRLTEIFKLKEEWLARPYYLSGNNGDAPPSFQKEAFGGVHEFIERARALCIRAHESRHDHPDASARLDDIDYDELRRPFERLLEKDEKEGVKDPTRGRILAEGAAESGDAAREATYDRTPRRHQIEQHVLAAMRREWGAKNTRTEST